MLPLMLPLLQTFGAEACSKPTFLGLVPWYQYLNVVKDYTGRCSVTNFDVGVLGGHSPFLLIALAVLDDLIRVAGLVAVGYVIWGGIQYVTSQGSPDGTKKAQQTVLNALIGVAISIMAASLVAFVGNKLAAAGSASISPSGLPTAQANPKTLSSILDLVFAIVASISVLIIVIGGFRYIVAHGDPNGTVQARNTVLYAVVGLLITMAAFAIVTFVVKGIS